MLQEAARHPRQVFAGVFQHRHEPVNRTLHDIIQSGTLGTMLTAAMQIRCWRSPEYYRGDAWRGTWAQEGGAVLINQAIHYVDLLQWLMGGVRSVSGVYVNRAHQDCMETEDVVTAALAFTSGALGTLEATCASHLGWEPTLHFHGTEGSIELRNNRPVKLLFRDAAVQAAIQARFDAHTEEATRFGKAYYGAGHAAQITDVLLAIAEGRAPFVTAREAAATVDLVLGGYESHRTGRTVSLAVRR
jgi:predicted dehydrogenase